jgi:hypothetical protein
VEKGKESRTQVDGYFQAPPNKGMQPTRDSVALKKCSSSMIDCCARRG